MQVRPLLVTVATFIDSSSVARIIFRRAPLALLLVGACDASGPLVYTAQPYFADAGCVGAYVPIGLIAGNSLSATCPAACLTVNDQLYVSTACPPYPSEAVPASDSPDCPAALDAADASAQSGLLCGAMTAAPTDDGGAPDGEAGIDP